MYNKKDSQDQSYPIKNFLENINYLIIRILLKYKNIQNFIDEEAYLFITF